MKVIVTELPVTSKDCIFAEYINMTSKYKCMFQSGMYSRCKLDYGNKIYICYPPNVGRTNTILLMRALETIFERGENDAELHI